MRVPKRVFHPSSLVNFRNRLEEHQQSALGFTTILNALEEPGLIPSEVGGVSPA
jgi:hypothetical protein